MDQTRQKFNMQKATIPKSLVFSCIKCTNHPRFFGVSNFVYFDWYPCVRDIGHPNGRPQKSIQQPSTWPSQTRRPRAIQEDFRSSSSLALIWVRMEPWNYIFLHCFSCILTKWSKLNIYLSYSIFWGIQSWVIPNGTVMFKPALAKPGCPCWGQPENHVNFNYMYIYIYIYVCIIYTLYTMEWPPSKNSWVYPH